METFSVIGRKKAGRGVLRVASRVLRVGEDHFRLSDFELGIEIARPRGGAFDSRFSSRNSELFFPLDVEH